MRLGTPKVYFVLAGLLAIVATGIYLLSGDSEKTPLAGRATTSGLATERGATAGMQAHSGEHSSPETSIESGGEEVASAAANPASGNEGTRPGADLPYMQPVKAAVHPDDQPRTFWMRDFRPMKDLPEGYSVEGLRLTERGIELEPLAEGVEPAPRTGVIESAPEIMDFEYNGLVPMWRQQAPDGTALVYEIAVSPDGENWTGWTSLEPVHDEVSATYPDGSPNPNFGFTPAGVHMGDTRLWNFARYRVTLYSETGASPTLEAFRLYVMDSTLGEGHLAEVVTEDAEAATP